MIDSEVMTHLHDLQQHVNRLDDRISNLANRSTFVKNLNRAEFVEKLSERLAAYAEMIGNMSSNVSRLNEKVEELEKRLWDLPIDYKKGN
jgi:archaellum component FlaC